MASPYTDAQIAKKVCDALNDQRGHAQARSPVLHATYTSGSSFVLVLRVYDDSTGDRVEKTVTIS